MSLVQFWRILWARKSLVLVAALCSMLGAVAVIVVVSPRWVAHARVLLNFVKPDPVTGEIMGGATSESYIASQIELIEDYSVAGLAVDRLGWMHDPELAEKYRERPDSDHRDFRRWLAQRVTEKTEAEAVAGSNILEISFTAKSPAKAQAGAEALRQAYLDTSLSMRRADANRNASWFVNQAANAKSSLDEAERAESDYERVNNVYMATDTVDLDSARLSALAAEGTGNTALTSGVSTVGTQLAEVNAEIAQLSQSLGPNHPQIQALRAKKAALSSMTAREPGGLSAGRTGNSAAVDAQAAIVMANHNKVARLKQLRAEVDVRRNFYNKTFARAVELRQQAAVTDVGLTPLGSVVEPHAPAFPNVPLIILGSLVLGLASGVLIALLVELLQRRVRGCEDLLWAVDAPMLAMVVASSKRSRWPL